MGSTTLTYLDPAEVTAWLPEGAAQPRVEIAGRLCILAAKIRRAFPLAHPEEYLSIQNDAGKEIGLLRSLDGIEPATRATLEEELDRRYFSPRISRIDGLEQQAGLWRFRVQTQRGPCEFFVRNWRDSAHEMGSGRWQIVAVDGQKYDIENLEKFDERSQGLLDQVF
ncbi:MAG: DUF1854 domain-containing protein [Fimbriimonas ginsengisoli]|uniref:DUF1854 domain-containing protein n=1 Tax=Fimbriimonas ginsengisoli TaxID=1005039 RepID=A0A931LUG7_FIMGI|nr:DUF1854 domain-containing protein [Fimbriimonas ginsengisoli]MBI3721597.1 DUF1854 domain-containing protein [Fimbriimonas ginsengisoli]